jgi:hypothetical protein
MHFSFLATLALVRAKIPFGELVETTGLSPKTVRKHLNLLLETKTISIDPLLGALTDSGELIYPLVVAGKVSIDEVQKIMGESAQTHHTLSQEGWLILICHI